MNWRQAILPACLVLAGCGGTGSETRAVTFHITWDPSTEIQQVLISTMSDTHGQHDYQVDRPLSGTSNEVTITATTDCTVRVIGFADPAGNAAQWTGELSHLPLQNTQLRFGGPVREIHLKSEYFRLGSGKPDSFQSPQYVGEFPMSGLRAYGIGDGGEIVLFSPQELTFSSSNPSVVAVSGAMPSWIGPGTATLSVQAGASGPTDSWDVTVAEP